MKTVFIQGTYDLLNAGHVRTFHDLAGLGRVIVGLNTDRLVAEHKPGQPIMPFEQRKEILEGLQDVSEVITCDDALALPYLLKLEPDYFASVREWEQRQQSAIAWMKAQGKAVVFTTYYPDDGVILSSSDIRARIRGA